jgi:Tfp pilus assembly protein PilF
MSSLVRNLALSGGLLGCCLSSVSAQMTMPACHQMGPAMAMPAPKDLPAPRKMAGLGNLHFPIHSKNPETQMWFDQGMNLVFDFWDYEANRAFEQAVRTDPDCAICHWALAESMGFQNQELQGYAHDELMQAVALRSHADRREKLYIDAAQAESGAIVSKRAPKDGEKDRTQEILRAIVKKYPTDTTAKLMLVETIEDGYDRDTGKPRKGTAEAITILQGILKEKPDDSAANHLWIHAVEASPHPEQALESAKKLADLAPKSGHMTHMPGHIFYRVGDYERAQQSFDLSTSVDEAYMRDQHVEADDDWNYVHNLMYSIANLLEQGRMTDAAIASKKLTAARGVRASTLYPWSTRDAITRLDPMLPLWLRSANWVAIEKTLETAPEPAAQFPNLKVLSVSLMAFAQGMLAVDAKDYAAAKRLSAEMDAQLWRASQRSKDGDPKDEKKDEGKTNQAPVNQVVPTDPNLEAMLKNLAILSLELRSAVLMGDGKTAEAEALLTQAQKDEVELGYHEPPAFIQPVAEFEAAQLEKAGKKDEAEKAWKQALADRPNSGYPLYGMAEMAAAGGDAAKAREAYAQFLATWKHADENLPQVMAAREWMQAHPATALALVK